MFDYNEFKISAYKYKYETAIETSFFRLTYGELLTRINAVSNSLFQMRLEGGIALLSRDAFTVFVTACAASKAGIPCVIADSKMQMSEAEALIKKYTPQAVFLPTAELERIGGVFCENGCKTCIATEGTVQENSIFPSQFDFDSLIKINDYVTVREASNTTVKTCFFDGEDLVTPDLSAVFCHPIREGVYTDVPVFEPVGACILSALLKNGRKYCNLGRPDKKVFKKHKITTVITDARYEINADIIEAPAAMSYLRVGGGLFRAKKLSKELTQAIQRQTECEFSDGKIRVVVTLLDTDDTKGLSKGSELAKTVISAANDILYPFETPKSFIFKRK